MLIQIPDQRDLAENEIRVHHCVQHRNIVELVDSEITAPGSRGGSSAYLLFPYYRVRHVVIRLAGQKCGSSDSSSIPERHLAEPCGTSPEEWFSSCGTEDIAAVPIHLQSPVCYAQLCHWAHCSPRCEGEAVMMV